MRIGIFGGTFNPVHYGHLRAAEEVRMKIGLDQVIFVPSHIPPHKELDGGVPAEKRLALVNLAVQDNQGFTLSTFEVEQGGSSYSIRTIEHVRETFGVTPHFILGQDAFNEISTWYEAARLFDLAHFVVMSRPNAARPGISDVLGESSGRFTETGQGFRNSAGNEIIFVEVTPMDISSSLVRELSRQGKSIRYLVPDEVGEYIRKERLYE